MKCPRRFIVFRKRSLTVHHPAYLDLRNVLKSMPRKGMYQLDYSADDWHDVLHALNLRGTGVNLIRCPGGGHGLVKHLRESGELKRALVSALEK